MAYNTGHNLNVWNLHAGQLVNISASASVSYVAVPFAGVLIDAWSCMAAAITVATCTITVKKKSGSAAAVDLGTIVITTGASAIGKVIRWTTTANEADRTFVMGDTLEFASDGASTTTSIGAFNATFKGM